MVGSRLIEDSMVPDPSPVPLARMARLDGLRALATMVVVGIVHFSSEAVTPRAGREHRTTSVTVMDAVPVDSVHATGATIVTHRTRDREMPSPLERP